MVRPSGAGAVIGVLDLQGDVREHVVALSDVGVASQLVRRPEDLHGLAGCVLPGGESTTLSMLLESSGLWGALGTRIAGGFPVFGTCAGLVLLAREILDGRNDQRSFGALDVVVRRNGFGRQLQSFESELKVGEVLGGEALPAVFIRAPMVVRAGSPVEVLASIERERSAESVGDERGGDERGGEVAISPVLVRQGHVLASSFHPELTADRRLHRLFAQMCGS